jgi:hypothetical protein
MDLEQKSIERIKIASEMSLHHYGKPLICTYSGGKDSDGPRATRERTVRTSNPVGKSRQKRSC